MFLQGVRIRDYRSVEDSGAVPVETDVTCLVGKNESGKTAFLQALHLLNPLNPIKGKKTYDDVMDYPSRKSSAYKRTRDTKPATVIEATFRLEDHEAEAVRADLGPDALTGHHGHGQRRLLQAQDLQRALQPGGDRQAPGRRPGGPLRRAQGHRRGGDRPRARRSPRSRRRADLGGHRRR